MKQFILSFVILIIIGVAGGLGFIYSGAFDVAATSKDSALLEWILETTRERSIESRAEVVTAPDDASLNTPENIRIGFEHYDEMCVVCHGAPGIDAGEAREGLNPKPPLLAKLKDISTDPPGEIYWIIKNGIKMTGMPAWGPTHDANKIWAMVAFVRKLPNMTADEYKVMRYEASKSNRKHDDDHGEQKPHTH